MTEKKKGLILLAVFVLMISTPFIYKVFAPDSDSAMTQRIEQIKKERKEKKGQKNIKKFQEGMDKRFQDSGNTDLEQEREKK